MRAIVLPAPGQSLQVDENHPEPDAGKEGGEIVEVAACGVCHSDLHVVDGEFAGSYLRLLSVWGSRSRLDELLDPARREPTIIQGVETLPLHEAQQAHDRLRAGEVRGRMVLVVAGSTKQTTTATPPSERDLNDQRVPPDGR